MLDTYERVQAKRTQILMNICDSSLLDERRATRACPCSLRSEFCLFMGLVVQRKRIVSYWELRTRTRTTKPVEAFVS